MLLKIGVLLVTGLVARSTALAIKPHKVGTDYERVPGVVYESAQTSNHEKLTLRLFWGSMFMPENWMLNASETWQFTSGPEQGCNTITQRARWPLLTLFWESARAVVGAERADASVSVSLAKTVFEVSIMACKNGDQYDLKFGVSSPQKGMEVSIYEAEELRDEFLKPGVVEDLEAKIWAAVVGQFEEYLTPKLAQRVEKNVNRSKFGLVKFTRQLADATEKSYPLVDLTAY